MGRMPWSVSTRVVVLLGLLASCKPAQGTRTASALNPWLGEWALSGGEGEVGSLSIRDCLVDQKLCVLRFQTGGRRPGYPSQVGDCSYGNPRDPRSPQNKAAFKAEGQSSSLELAPPWGSAKDCTLALDIDETQQPLRIKADLHGSDCASHCSGNYTHFPAVFTLRSRKPYLQSSTYSKSNICYKEDTRAIQAWCTDENLFALHQTWKVRLQQLDANSKVNKDKEGGEWQDRMLDACKSAGDPIRCITDGYEQQIRDLGQQVYPRFLEQKVSAEQILAALYPKFDPRTAKTGDRTDINTKDSSPELKDKPSDALVVFFKIAELPFLPGHVVALDVVSDSFQGYKARAFFSLVRAEAGQLKVVGRDPVGDPPEQTLTWYDERSGSSLKLDLANYKINDNERAFGYRLATWDGGTGASYGIESLLLYRATPQGMQRVLDVAMESDAAAWDNQEGKVYKDKKQKFVLIVSPNQHEGNYDWILKGRIINKRLKRSRAAKGQTYVWKNGGYVPEGD